MNKTYHIVYKITNLINGKFYIGKHTTNNLEDDYFGSGKLINQAIEKYGIEFFEKEILSFHKTGEEALEEEKRLLTEELIEDRNCYNLKPGGLGGWEKNQGKKNWNDPELRKRLLSSLRGRIWINNGLENKFVKESFLKENSEWKKGRFFNRLIIFNIETKDFKTINLSEKEMYIYDNTNWTIYGSTSSLGKVCVTNGEENKFIYPDKVDSFLEVEKEWRLGSFSKPSKGKIIINNSLISRVVDKEEAKEFLEKNSEWKKGLIIRNRTFSWVTNKKIELRLNEENVSDFLRLNKDWTRGRITSPTKGKVPFHFNGKIVYTNDPEGFLKENPEWLLGTGSSTVKDMINVTDGVKDKLIKKEDAKQFLEKNTQFKLGSCLKGASKGTVWVHKENSSKRVKKLELDSFLKSNPSWSLGRS